MIDLVFKINSKDACKIISNISKSFEITHQHLEYEDNNKLVLVRITLLFRNCSCINRISCKPFRLSINGPKDEIVYFLEWFRKRVTLKFNVISNKQNCTDNVEFHNCNIDITNHKSKSKQKKKVYDGYLSFREVPSSVGIKFYGTKP